MLKRFDFGVIHFLGVSLCTKLFKQLVPVDFTGGVMIISRGCGESDELESRIGAKFRFANCWK